MNNTASSAHDVTVEESYDAIPYPGGCYRTSHPSHLAMVARLCGIKPAAPGKCRVLELGCSLGKNLIPMAQDLPHSEFIGIDLSARQVEGGRAAVEELELQNIKLEHLAITDFDDRFGKFDYILCHGVYSWVSPEVQQAILKIGQEYLTSNGILYVSYNTYPGWHLRGVIREMMRYHVANFESPQEKIRQARGLLDFLVKSAKSRSQAYTTLLKEEAEILEKRIDAYIYHEHLEEVNDPVYFHEFVKRVDAAGLRYLADAAISSMVAQVFDESAADLLRDVPLLRREQYMDFLRARMFRSSLLCRPDVAVNYQMPSTNLVDLHVVLKQPLIGEPAQGGEVVWRRPQGQLTTEQPITAAIERLNQQFPAWLPVRELIAEVPDEPHQKALLDALLMGMVKGFFHLAEDPPPICAGVTERPKCTPLSRWQARSGNKITNRLHADWVVQPQQRLLIEHMDGSRTAKELAEVLRASVAAGKFQVTREGRAMQPDADECLRIVQGELERLRLLAMLVD